MASYLIVILGCIAFTHAIVLPGTSIYQPTILTKQIESVDLRPQYTFSYQVNDPKTGDIKNQIESRDGDVVKGSYSLLDADGLTRVVQYTSDKLNGFNAVVSRTPLTKQVIKSVPILQQPTLIRSIPSIIQAPSLIQTQNILRPSLSLVQSPQLSLGQAYSSSSIVRSPATLGVAVSGIKSPSLIQSPQLSLGQAYSSSSLIRSPATLGVSVSGLKSSPLIY